VQLTVDEEQQTRKTRARNRCIEKNQELRRAIGDWNRNHKQAVVIERHQVDDAEALQVPLGGL
jgi:hypothetical protein